MWCTPSILQSKDGLSYDITESNEFFEVHHCKKVNSTIHLFKEYMNKIMSSKELEINFQGSQSSYRIILKADRQYVIAVGTKEGIEKKWDWIKEEILPTVQQYKANNIQDPQALFDFLLVKFDSVNTIQDKEFTEHRNEEFNKLFNLKNEKLVSTYHCTLYKIGEGDLYVSENYICFHRTENDPTSALEKLTIPQREIAMIKKRSWLQDPAISIITKKKKEYYWSSFTISSRDEAFVVIEQVWQQTLSKILKSVENISILHSPSSHSAIPLQKMASQEVIDLHSLEKSQSSIRNNKLLRLPLSEKHILYLPCKTWEGRSERSIHLCISNFFLSYQSKSGKYFRMSIPFREIFNITKEDKTIGGNAKALKVIGKNRRYIFLFDSLSDRNNVYECAIDRWNHVILECEFLTFVQIKQHPQVGMSVLLDDRREFTANYHDKQQKAEPMWHTYFEKHGKGSGMVEDVEYIEHLLRLGAIPDVHRKWLWPLFSGAVNKAQSEPNLGYYHSLLTSHDGEFSKAMDEIDKDLKRSFPEHPHFSTEEGLESLKNVLTAYSWRNPVLGYCQSMNIIASLLLCYLDEEWAFWTLAAICEDLAPENYDKNMIGSIVDVSAFEDLLARFLPQIFTQLKSLSIPISVISQGWFLCLFVGYVPMEAALRALDSFFFSRGKMLFAMGLAVFKCCEQRILNAKESDELMYLLKDLHDLFQGEEMLNNLLKATYDFVDILDNDKLHELRGFQKFKAVKEVEKTTRYNTIRLVIEKGTKFEEHELYRLYEYYYSEASSTDFIINEEQFANIIVKILPWMALRHDLISPFFNDYLDADHDGKVDFFTYVEGVYVASNGSLRDKLQFYFNLHDGDHNGLLDKGDYYKVLDAVARSFFENENIREVDLMCLVNWTFDQAEKENGQISLESVSSLLLSAEEEEDVNNSDQLGLLEHFLKL